MHRRMFLKSALAASVPTTGFVAAYGLFEAGHVRIDRQTLTLARLPRSFDGLTLAFLTDIHHGPFTSLDYVSAVVRTALVLRPDLIVLGGDYSLKDRKYIRPCLDVHAALTAPFGVYGVLGNHDYWHGVAETRDGMKAAHIEELTNAGVWLRRGSDRFRLAGVDDLWTGRADVTAALGDATDDDACLLVSHNPDLAEELREPRVGLILSGHTHGGQVIFPTGAPFVPSIYGQKYLHGLVRAPATQVYVSRGLGTSGVPIRVACRPEINLITLKAA